MVRGEHGTKGSGGGGVLGGEGGRVTRVPQDKHNHLLRKAARSFDPGTAVWPGGEGSNGGKKGGGERTPRKWEKKAGSKSQGRDWRTNGLRGRRKADRTKRQTRKRSWEEKKKAMAKENGGKEEE